MIIGYFDYTFIGFLILLNIFLWKKKINGKIGFLVGILSFGLILPFVSQIIEIQHVEKTIGIIDNFEVLYTYLKFPFYWILGFAQLIIAGIRYGNKKTEYTHKKIKGFDNYNSNSTKTDLKK